MSWNRREVLGGLGIASAHSLLWALGCTGGLHSARVRAPNASGEIRMWLRDAVATLHGAGFTTAHALAVSRSRRTAAIDVLGANVAHARCDGVVLSVETGEVHREQVTSELTRDGIAAAVRVLAGTARPALIDFGPPPPPALVPNPDPETLTDASLIERVGVMAKHDAGLSSRIVYAASLLDIDDAMVWSVAQGRDLEQRRYRVRRSLTRVAWNGTRPIVSEVSRAWSGGIDDQTVGDDQIASAADTALALMTPGVFDDGEHSIILAPSVVATLLDATVRALLHTRAVRRPEVAQRLAFGVPVASPVLTLIDDPTVAHSYGGFEFDDEGEPATPLTLLDHGTIAGRLADRAGVAAQLATRAGRGRRPGYIGAVEPAPSHLRLVPGTQELVLDNGYLLEGGLGAVVDPSSKRIVVAAQRALEIRGGKHTGRIYADIELVGDLAAVLTSISEASQQTEMIGLRDEVDGQPRWTSIETPWLRGKAMIRARRRPA